MTHKAVSALIVAGVAVATIVFFNSLSSSSKQAIFAPWPAPPVEIRRAAERLAGAVRIQTISYGTASEASGREFLMFHSYLQDAFPTVRASLQREIVNKYSLLYTWEGVDPAARPIVLMAHQDVVPLAPGSEAQWHAGPFSGAIEAGFVWGRGTWDDKGNLMAILEAVETLAAAGFKPQRTIYFVFGHDEENGGEEGAKIIASLFKQRGIRPEFVLDEGLLIADGIMPGLDSPVALIGIAEKGSATLRLTAQAPAGHSSMPGSRTAIGSLAAALARLERKPLPASVTGVAAKMMHALAPEMHGLNRVALSNMWLVEPLVRWQLMRAPSTNALLRTTTAITVVKGGNKDNVLPAIAEALVNFRLLPGETVGGLVAHVRGAINDAMIRIDVLPQSSEASPIASDTSVAFQLITRTIRELFPDVVVAPGLMIGATDSRHMSGLADNVYRFSPVRARAEDLARFHGTDERISLANYAELIGFYHRLITHAASAP
ncbi:MAG: M20 family peptidase [Pseudomonadota bacterium]|nr:M20 family peptidase [Pseudomonadota bacterium]